MSRLPPVCSAYSARCLAPGMNDASLALGCLWSKTPRQQGTAHQQSPLLEHLTPLHERFYSLDPRIFSPQRPCYNAHTETPASTPLPPNGQHVAVTCQTPCVPPCRGSPTSQKIVFRHVKAARNMSLARVLETDFRLLHHMCHISNDFVEGIRAKLIEKDDSAHWKPATIQEVRLYCRHTLFFILSGLFFCSCCTSQSKKPADVMSKQWHVQRLEMCWGVFA